MSNIPVFIFRIIDTKQHYKGCILIGFESFTPKRISGDGERGRGSLVVNTSDSGSRGRGFEPHSDRRVMSLSKTYLPPKSTCIPRKRWLRPNMTEKLFTGTFSIKPNKKKTNIVHAPCNKRISSMPRRQLLLSRWPPAYT